MSGGGGDDGQGGVLHLWRVVSVMFGGPIEAVYECELCGDRLQVPAGGVHPAEC
ncbi:MAG: hypothetical protein H5T80_11780 [Dietzia sp.]|nr:hypothetical protein [Dietzia sp.]